MHQEGYKVVGMADITGSLFNPRGLDVPRLLAYLKEHKTVEAYSEAEHISTADLLELECEILMPAATEISSFPSSSWRTSRRSWTESAGLVPSTR